MNEKEKALLEKYTKELKNILYFHSYPLTTTMEDGYTYGELESLIDYLTENYKLTYED